MRGRNLLILGSSVAKGEGAEAGKGLRLKSYGYPIPSQAQKRNCQEVNHGE